MRRDLVVLSRPDPDPGGPAGVPVGAVATVGGAGDLPGVVADLPHPDAEVRGRFGRRRRLPVDAVVWLAPDQPVPDDFERSYAVLLRATVETHVGWPAPDTPVRQPAAVVKQVSLLAAADGYDPPRFASHYRGHVEVARRHMPALWQYVQNRVVSTTADTEATRAIVAVSELWFATTEDFLQRYFPSADDEAQFRSHEDFLDLSKAASFVCTSYRLADAGDG